MNLRANIFALILLGFSSFALAAPDDKNAARPATSRELAEDAVVGDVLLQAMSLMGIAYRFGGTNPNTGFDCSGFIRYIFQRSIGVNLPRTAAEQAKIGRSVDRSELKPGDILFFNTRGFANSHNGLYLGNGRFVHAPRTGKNIEIANLGSSYWTSRFNGARRVTRSNAYAGNLRDEVVSRKKVEVAAAETSSPRRSIKNVNDPLENLATEQTSPAPSSDVVASSTLGAAGVLASGAAVALLADASSRLKNREKERAQALKALHKPGAKIDKNDEERTKKSKKRKERSASKYKKSSSKSSAKKSSSSKKSSESKKLTAGKGKKS